MSDETVILKLGPVVLGRGQVAPPESKTETVSGFILDAVNETCREPTAHVVQVKGPVLEAKSMVGVITYCYAKGVLSASEIERGLWKDDELRSVCAANIPTARTISRFRRLNRQVIQCCLEKALRRVRRALAQSTLSQGVHCGGADTRPKPAPVTTTAPAPGEGTTILIRRDVTHRLENAALLDSDLVNE